MSAELIRDNIASAVSKAIEVQDAAREWIGKRGGENTPTFLLLECDRAISDLRAAIAAADAAIAQAVEQQPAMSALAIVRQYPDFDAGGPLADMMDEVLAGRPAPLLSSVLALAAGFAPAAQPVPAQAVAPEGWRDEVARLMMFSQTAMHASSKDQRNALEDIADRLAEILKRGDDAAAPAAPTTGAGNAV